VRQGITLIRVVESVQITPEPDEGERRAILAALADEAAERRMVSEWAAALLPARDGEEEPP
jgi:hypothetical protein